ncbi:MAG: vitamin B12-dependent ribonucleotide reductase [Euryarchaeota archaeon]|nr:vitamin B12-dependent ribonucleotide reductase [Euryarchaeota archaeon]
MTEAQLTQEVSSGEKKGLVVRPYFSDSAVDPYDEIEWVRHHVQTRDRSGKVLFDMEDVEAPDFWSARAVQIAAEKYFRKAGLPLPRGHESSIKELVSRVSEAIAAWGREHGYFATAKDADLFERELRWLLVNQYAAFNSPVWFNCGLHHKYGTDGTGGNWTWDMEKGGVYQVENNYERPQCSACFILSVEDTLIDKGGIMDFVVSEARIFKYGSGSGANFSRVRGAGEPLSGGGTSSGLMSFLKIPDVAAGSIKSGGTTRRAAKMVILDDDHPEIMEFIRWKAREEDKARLLLESGIGLDSSGVPDFNGEAYQTVSGQNSNNSVRLSDAFMKAYLADTPWTLKARTSGKTLREVDATEMMREIAKAAWRCADPGVQFHDTINTWHTCPESGPIRGSNPCSEYMFLDNTACNLASLNLMKFLADDGSFDAEGYAAANRIVFMAQEIIVDLASYPTEQIGKNSHDYRPLGLGYANLGTLLMCMGLPYDSKEGRGIASTITAIMNGVGYLTSAEMAAVQGPFAGYRKNEKAMLQVMARHREHAVALLETGSAITADNEDQHRVDARTESLAQYAVAVWDKVLEEGEKHGFRNSQATVLAPTGTIGFLMDCDTTGIEPDFSLVKWKLHAGGEWRQIINQSIPLALERLGYSEGEVDDIILYVLGDGATPGKETVEGAPHLKKEHLPVFDCANTCGEDGTRYIHHMGHVRMMAAAQPFISGAISKTVNLPATVTPEDIQETYVESWRLGLKAMAIYRDGSKHSQPLSSKTAKKAEAKKEEAAEVAIVGPKWGELRELKDTTSQVWKTKVTVHDPELGTMNVHITFREDDDGALSEIFLNAGNKGSGTQFLCDSLAKAWSRQLRLGYTVASLAGDLVGQNGPIRGMTGHPFLKNVKGIEDLVGKLLAYHYLGETRFINPELLEKYRQSLDYEPPRHEYLDQLRLFRNQMTKRPEKTLSEFVEEEPKSAKKNGGGKGIDVMGKLREDKTCGDCGFMMVRNGACHKCINCGATDGCS